MDFVQGKTQEMTRTDSFDNRSLRRFESYPAYKPSDIPWLGGIPAHWEVKRLKYLATFNDDVLAESTDPDFEMAYVDISSVDGVHGIMHTEPLTFDKAPSRARRLVKHGDVIISTVRTYLRAVAPIVRPQPNLVVSTGFAVIRPIELVNSFAAYVLTAPYFVDRVVADSVGANYPAINASDLACLDIAFPPLPEQRAIAAFLDRETGKIDALVAKKERLIELLQEKRTALISRAVTKGLDPNVPMKDSGVEWLGEIPAHWEVKDNRWLFRESDLRSLHGEEELLTVSHITGVTRRSEKPNVTMIEAESYDGYKVCRVGDLAINTMWTWMGALGVAFSDGIVSPSYNVYRMDRDKILPRYYDYLCRSPMHVTEIARHSKGVWTSRLRLYPEAFWNIKTVLPPLSEQQVISDHLDSETAKVDALIDKVCEAVERLKELRAALISAAVTGRIDVREVAG